MIPVKHTFLLFFCILAVIISAQETKNISPSLRGSGLCFTANKGQFVDTDKQLRPDILFKGTGVGADIYLRKNGISFVTSDLAEKSKLVHEKIDELKQKNTAIHELELRTELERKQIITEQRIDVDFVNSNSEIEYDVADQIEGYENFYYPHCPNGITHVLSYNEICIKNIYNNINVKYYGNKEKGLKYDIVIKPGGNPSDIQLKYKGTKGLYIQNGHLYIKTFFGEMEEWLPKVYQSIEGRVIDVDARYELSDNGTIVKFKLGKWDRKYDLIIDPYVWATYFGGTSGDDPKEISVDALGNPTICGNTSSSNFPTTVGAFQKNNPPDKDAFVVKFDPNGIRLWATYYGGSDVDAGTGIDTDASGNSLVTGITASSDFPVTGAVCQTVKAGVSPFVDAFIIKFDPSGVRQWATFYGGTDDENVNAITVDFSGNSIITGSTISTDLPTMLPYQSSSGGMSDGFVAKFDPNGNCLWSTYYGGSVDEFLNGIASDASGNIIVTGNTNSANFPFSPLAFQTVLKGAEDATIVKFDPSGVRMWATFLGGSYAFALSIYEVGNDVTVDSFGNIIVIGNTVSPDFPVTAGTFQPILGGATLDAFIAKFNPAGNELWATFHGGSNAEQGAKCAVDSYNNIFVLGEWEESDNGSFPMNTCALQKTFGGIEDYYITKLSPSGKRICSTFIGGTQEENLDPGWGGGGLELYGNYMYVAGTSPFNGFPITANAFQFSNAGYDDAIVLKFCANSCGEDNPMIINIASSASICTNAAVQFNSTVTSALTCDTAFYSYQWTFQGGIPATSTVQNPSGIAFPVAGIHNIKLIVNSGCGNDSSSQNITVNNCACALTASIGVPTNIQCNGLNNGSANVTISNGSGGTYTYNWSNGSTTGNNTSVANNYTITSMSAGTYTVTVSDGVCTTTSTVSLTQPTSIIASTTQLTATTCGNNTGVALASATGGNGGFTYTWSNTSIGNTANNLSANNYTVTVTDGNGCTSTNTVTITNSNGPNIATQNTTGTCIGQITGQASITISGGTGPYTYSWSNGTSLTTSSLNHSITSLPASTYTVTITDNNNCTRTTAITVIQFPNPTANAGTDQTITSGTSIQLTASGGTSYLWTPSATLSNAGINNPIANPTQTTTYTVTVTDANSCSSVDDITVTVTTPQTCNASEADEFVANVFTPNGDGRNDVLFVKGNGLTNIYFAIYNRWGQKLFETTDQTTGWDGTQNGKPIDEQTVVYYLKATCITTGENIVKKGDVSVVR